MDLSVARVAHACRKNRRGRRCVRSDGRATRGVHKGKRRRVEEGCCMRSTDTAKDATALSAMMTSFHEGEGFTANKGIAMGGIGILLPEITGKKDG
jgi:hypothetical protein